MCLLSPKRWLLKPDGMIMIIIIIIHWVSTLFLVLNQFCPFYRTGEQGLARFNNLPQVTELNSGRAGIWTKPLSDSQGPWHSQYTSHWCQGMKRKWMLSTIDFFSGQESELQTRRKKSAMSWWHSCGGVGKSEPWPEFSFLRPMIYTLGPESSWQRKSPNS